MSWDVSLVVDTGGPEPAELSFLDANYTHNVQPMFALAGLDLGGLHGERAGEAAAKLTAAIAAMRQDPERFRAMNPPNGWGDYDGALAFLERIRTACLAHPLATVRVS